MILPKCVPGVYLGGCSWRVGRLRRSRPGTLCCVVSASGSDSTTFYGTLGRSAQEPKGALGNYHYLLRVNGATCQVLCLPSAWSFSLDPLSPGILSCFSWVSVSPDLSLPLSSLSLSLHLFVPFPVSTLSVFSPYAPHLPHHISFLSVRTHTHTLPSSNDSSETHMYYLPRVGIQ